MKYLIIPPDDYDVPNEDYKLYDRTDEALKALEEMDGTIAGIERYKIVAVAMEYKVLVQVKPSGSIEGKEFEIVDSDGDELCSATRNSVERIVAHFKEEHGEDVYLSDVSNYSISNKDDADVELDYDMKIVGLDLFTTTGTAHLSPVIKEVEPKKAEVIVPASRINELEASIAEMKEKLKQASSKPNEIVLGDE